MHRLLILKVGSTVPGVLRARGDFDRWFREALPGMDEVRVVEPHLGEALPPHAEWSAAVVTGSPAMITDDEAWSTLTGEWMRAAVGAGVAVLGVCYGHQLLARALGGAAGWNPKGREIGTVDVALTPAGVADPLFAGLPAHLRVHATHSQSVLGLPQGGVLLGASDHDAHQAFRVGDRAWGVQFHPEFDADILRGYFVERREELASEGIDAEGRLAGVVESEHGRRILANFAECARREG